MKQILLVFTLLVSVFVVGTSNLYAQQDYLHSPLKSEGKIPSAFLNTVQENYAINSQNRTESELDDFNVISGYAIKQLLWSGKIVFGDTVTRYLNRIVDVILEDNPTLRQQIQIYTVKSSVVNAFTTSEGFIFVNLGLIASCENEAQLAYILAHEISHYVKQHSVNRYTFKKKEEENANKFSWSSSKKDKVDYTARLNVSNYSKSQEIEADDYGLELFNKTAYSKNTAITGFKMLGSSDSLENRFSFEKSHFTNAYFQDFEDSLLRQREPPYFEIGEVYENDEYVNDNEKEEEDFSTHPNIDERIKNLSNKIDSTLSDQPLYLVTDKEGFKKIQRVAQYEVLEILLRQARYIDVVHQTSLLINKYGKSYSLNMTMAKATYGIAKYGNVDEKIIMNYKYGKIEWKDKNWYAALGELSASDRTIFALTFLFSNLDNNIDTLYSKKAITDLLTDIYIYHDDLLKEDLEADSNLLKKIWINKIKTHSAYNQFLEKAKKEFDEYQEWENFKEDDKGMVEYRKRVAKARFHGFELGVDNIMVTDVRYIKVNTKNGTVAPLKTIIEKEEYAIKSIEESSEKLNLNTTILDPKSLDKTEITLALFNDLATINDWYIAQSDVDDIYSFVPSNHTQIEELAERNGTRHLVRMAMLDAKVPAKNGLIGGYIMLFTIPTAYFLPYTAYRIYVKHEALIITEIYDIDKNRPLVIYNVSGMPFGKTNMKQNIFFQLSQIKTK